MVNNSSLTSNTCLRNDIQLDKINDNDTNIDIQDENVEKLIDEKLNNLGEKKLKKVSNNFILVITFPYRTMT